MYKIRTKFLFSILIACNWFIQAQPTDDSLSPNDLAAQAISILQHHYKKALKDNDVETIRICLSTFSPGFDINEKDPDGMTSVVQAANNNSADVLRVLLEAGADIEMADNDGYTPLMTAIAAKSFTCVKLLIEFGADMHSIRHVSNHGAKTTRLREYDVTPLIAASHSSTPEIIKYLLDSGARVEDNCDGDTALSVAILHEKFDNAKVLLEAGADGTRMNKSGTILLNIKGGITGLTFFGHAVHTRDKKLAEALLAAGADVNLQIDDTVGKPFLIDAIEIGDLEMVDLLIRHGVHVNDNLHHGVTPFHFAAHFGNVHIAQRLIEAGADINSNDWKGHTPLSIAIGNGNIKMIKFLLDAGAYIRRDYFIMADVDHGFEQLEVDRILEKAYKAQQLKEDEKIWRVGKYGLGGVGILWLLNKYAKKICSKAVQAYKSLKPKSDSPKSKPKHGFEIKKVIFDGPPAPLLLGHKEPTLSLSLPSLSVPEIKKVEIDHNARVKTMIRDIKNALRRGKDSKYILRLIVNTDDLSNALDLDRAIADADRLDASVAAEIRQLFIDLKEAQVIEQGHLDELAKSLSGLLEDRVKKE